MDVWGHMWRDRGDHIVTLVGGALSRAHLSWIPNFFLLLKQDHTHSRTTPTRSMARTALSIPKPTVTLAIPPLPLAFFPPSPSSMVVMGLVPAVVVSWYGRLSVVTQSCAVVNEWRLGALVWSDRLSSYYY